MGIALPAWGNAVNWWQSAMNAGYAVGSEPRAGAIAVWSGDTFGHVAYVVSGSGNTFVVNEGGRTDRDHTSSHGVVYGYEITNAVGGARPWDSGKKLLGFIYPVAEPPSNPQIALGQYWFDLADNVYVKVSADRAVSYFGALYKEGVRIWEGSIINGVLEFPATQFGVGRYSVYASCSNASGSIDTPWADFSVVAEAGYSGVSVSKRHYELNDIVSISVSTVCAHGQVIGIDKEGEGRIYTADTVSPYTVKADSLGKGNYSAYFSVYNHYGGVDTETLQFEVDQHSYKLIEKAEDGNEPYECRICGEKLDIDCSKEEYDVMEGDEFYIPAITATDTTKITWVSSDNNIVSVRNDGKLEGIKAGVCTVTVKAENIEKAYRVIVKKKNLAGPKIHSISAEKAYVSKDGEKVVMTVKGTALPEDLYYSIDSINVLDESPVVNPTQVKSAGSLTERIFEITFPSTSQYRETLQWKVKVSTDSQMSGGKGAVVQLISIQGDSVTEETIAALNRVIEEKYKLLEGDYTADSWRTYDTTIKKAEDLLGDKGEIATETACQYVIRETDTARKNLIEIQTQDNREKLSIVLEDAAKLKEEDYTADSWKEYEAAIENGRKLMADEEASEEAVQNAINWIEASKEALVIQSEEYVKVTKVVISTLAPSNKIAAGKKIRLIAKVEPDNAADKTVKWEVSNKKYASVNQNGEVTVKKAGSGKIVTITAAAADGSGKKAVYRLKIMKHMVKKIQLKAKKSIKAGKSMRIKPIIKTTGRDANKKLVWINSNPKYASVNSKGIVQTKRNGKNRTVRITARATDGSNKNAVIIIRIK